MSQGLKNTKTMSAFERTTRHWPQGRRDSLAAWAAENNLELTQPVILIAIAMWKVEGLSHDVRGRIETAIKQQEEVQRKADRRFYVAIGVLALSFVLSSYFGSTSAYGYGFSSGKSEGIALILNQLSKAPR